MDKPFHVKIRISRPVSEARASTTQLPRANFAPYLMYY